MASRESRPRAPPMEPSRLGPESFYLFSNTAFEPSHTCLHACAHMCTGMCIHVRTQAPHSCGRRDPGTAALGLGEGKATAGGAGGPTTTQGDSAGPAFHPPSSPRRLRPRFACLTNSVGGSAHPTAATLWWGGLPVRPWGASLVSVPARGNQTQFSPPRRRRPHFQSRRRPLPDTPGSGVRVLPSARARPRSRVREGPSGSLGRTGRCLALMPVR